MGHCARCGHAGLNHDIGGDCRDRECSCSGYKFTPAPSPARDDAEKAIAGLLNEHQPPSRVNSKEGWAECYCGERYAVTFVDHEMGYYADEWDATVLVLGGTNRKPVPRWFSQRLRELLGDA